MIALYRDISPDVLDEALKLRLDRTIAAAAAGQGDAATAADYYRRILDRVPDDDATLAALDTIYRGSGDAEALYEILLRRAELAKDPATESALRVQIGELAETTLGAPRGGDRRLRAGRRDRARRSRRPPPGARSPLHQGRALERSDRACSASSCSGGGGRSGSWSTCASGWRRSSTIAAAIARRRSSTCKLVLAGMPDHAGAIAMLEGMLDDVAVQGAAATLLEPVYAGRGDWKSLIKIGEIRLLQVEDPAERLAWTKRIARLYEEQLEDFDSALRWYGKVFQEAPDRAARHRAAAAPGRQARSLAGRRQPAGQLPRRRAVRGAGGAGHRPPDRGDLRPAAGRARRGAEVLPAPLRRAPRRPGDHAALRSGARALGSLGGAARAHRRAGRPGRRSRRRASRSSAAAPSWTRRSSTTRTAPSGRCARRWRSIPTDRKAASELERLLSQAGRWSDLADHLNSSLDREPLGADKDAATLRLAEILANRIGDTTSAVDRYAEILSRPAAPRDTAAAVSALEGLASDADQRHRVAAILEPVYRRAGDSTSWSAPSMRSWSRPTTAPSGCGSWARWPRSTSASAGSTWRSTAAAGPG